MQLKIMTIALKNKQKNTLQPQNMSLSHLVMFFFRHVTAVILSGCQKSETVAQEGKMICTDQSGRAVASGEIDQRPSKLQVSVRAIQCQRFSTVLPMLTGALGRQDPVQCKQHITGVLTGYLNILTNIYHVLPQVSFYNILT